MDSTSIDSIQRPYYQILWPKPIRKEGFLIPPTGVFKKNKNITPLKLVINHFF
jgi:hypothetical protein